jgi:hypothetical protein
MCHALLQNSETEMRKGIRECLFLQIGNKSQQTTVMDQAQEAHNVRNVESL